MRSVPGEPYPSGLIVRPTSGIARAVAEKRGSVTLVEGGEAAVPDTLLGVLLADSPPHLVGVPRAPLTGNIGASMGAPHGATVGAICEPLS
jgi:hypothetical protein